MKEMNSLDEMVEQLMLKDKKTLSIMLVGAIQKIELAKRALSLVLQYELEPQDTELINKTVDQLIK